MCIFYIKVLIWQQNKVNFKKYIIGIIQNHYFLTPLPYVENNIFNKLPRISGKLYRKTERIAVQQKYAGCLYRFVWRIYQLLPRPCAQKYIQKKNYCLSALLGQWTKNIHFLSKSVDKRNKILLWTCVWSGHAKFII